MKECDLLSSNIEAELVDKLSPYSTKFKERDYRIIAGGGKNEFNVNC